MTSFHVRASSHNKAIGHLQTVSKYSHTKTTLQDWNRLSVSPCFIKTEKVKQNGKTEEFVSNEKNNGSMMKSRRKTENTSRQKK